MTFEEVLNQVMALLQRQVSYRTLKRQFDLDEAYVEDVKLELIEVHQVAVDQDNTMLGRVDELFDDNPCGHEMNEGQKGLAQFLIPCRDASKLFEVVEEPFDLLA